MYSMAYYKIIHPVYINKHLTDEIGGIRNDELKKTKQLPIVRYKKAAWLLFLSAVNGIWVRLSLLLHQIMPILIVG